MLRMTSTKLRFGLLLAMTVALTVIGSGCLWGVVRDANTGLGVEGAIVTYTDANGNRASTTTGPGGLYSFGANSPAFGGASFDVTKAGYDEFTGSRAIQYNEGNFWEIQSFFVNPSGANVEPSHHFSGSVSHRGQATPSGVPVYAYIGSTVCGSATIDSGHYELWVVSAQQQAGCGYSGATVRFEVSSGPYAYQGGEHSWTAGGDTHLNLDLIYYSDADIFRGHARGAVDGLPVPNGVPVQAWIEGILCGEATISGGDGSYHLSVPSEGDRAGCGYPTATVTFTVGIAPHNHAAGSTSWPAGGGITTTFDLLVQP